MVALLRANLPALRGVYRYGSAGGEFDRPESDIDVAVLAAKPIEWPVLTRCAFELTRLAGRDVDLNDMSRLPVTLRVQIVTQGVRLYADDRSAADEYDSRVLSDYAHLNEARRGILEDVRARGRIHG